MDTIELQKRIAELEDKFRNHVHDGLDSNKVDTGTLPTSPGDATKFLNGANPSTFAQVKDSDLSTTDITTNNVSSTKHGFAIPFHRILSYAAAIDFSQDPQQRQFLAIQKDRLEKGLTRFYSKRNEDQPSRLIPSSRRNWRMYQ